MATFPPSTPAFFFFSKKRKRDTFKSGCSFKKFDICSPRFSSYKYSKAIVWRTVSRNQLSNQNNAPTEQAVFKNIKYAKYAKYARLRKKLIFKRIPKTSIISLSAASFFLSLSLWNRYLQIAKSKYLKSCNWSLKNR